MPADAGERLPTDTLGRLKATCVHLRNPDDGRSGTGYLVAPQRIGTAEHVVRGWPMDRPVDVAVGVGPARRACKARLLRVDAEHDAAVLVVEEPIDVEPLPVADALAQTAEWAGYGFPAAASGRLDDPPGLPLDGQVKDPSTRNDIGQDAVLLYSEIIAAGNASPLHGFSGSPVVVDGALVGHLTKHIGDPEDRLRPSYGYVYACPIAKVLALLDDGDLPLKRRIAPEPIVTVKEVIPAIAIGPDEYHVFVSYRSTDRRWAMSLVARLEGAGLKVFIDQQELKVGESLADQLESALARSRAAVVLVSQGWLESPWCQEEASVLKKRAVEDKQFKLLPLRLDGSAMPPFLDARLWLDFNGTPRAEGANVERLLNTLIDREPPPAESASARAETAERRVTDEFVARIRASAALPGATPILRLVDGWRKTASTDIAPLIAAAGVLNGQNRFDLALEVLKDAPETLRVRQLRGFALRKLGRYEEAIPQLEALRREFPGDAETGGLLAGSYKALWLKTGDQGLRQKAYLLYKEIHEATRDPFNGINAAAMALYCGDEATMHECAGKVVEALLARPADALDHWELATLGEGYLLRKRLDAARDWYGRAVAKAAGLHQDIAVMRRQARRNLEALKRSRGELDDVLPVPRVLAYTGHMADAQDRPSPRFPITKIPGVLREIRSRIERNGALHGFGCAARGTDLLFLKALAERGLSATVVLPFPELDFLALSGGGIWDTHYAALRQQAGIEIAPPLHAQRPTDAELPAAFAAANQEVLRRAIEYAQRLDETPLVIAVWDGQPGDGPGGTAEAVALWQLEGYDVDVIDITRL